MFDIHEIRAGFRSDARGVNVAADDFLHRTVAEHRPVVVYAEALVENRMAVRNARLGALGVVGPAEAAGVRQLKADDEIVGGSVPLSMGRHQRLSQPSQIAFVLFVNDELVRIRPAIGPHRHGLAPENELRAAFAETPPAPLHLFRDAARRGAVPAFHRLDGPAIAAEDRSGAIGGEAACFLVLESEARARSRGAAPLASILATVGRFAGGGAGLNPVVTRNLHTQRGHMTAKVFHRFERRNPGQLWRFHS